MINKAIIVGNLGADPELRTTAGGTPVCNFSVATTERRKVGDEWKDHTEWHKIIVWDKQAENCKKFLAKGRQVYIEGRLQTRKWQDKEGVDRWTTEIVADTVKFLGGAPKGDHSQGGNGAMGGDSAGGDEEIPF